MKQITLTDLLLKYGDENEARALLERLRWNGTPVCPRCGTIQEHKFTAREGTKTHARKGVYFCSDCRKQFTVTVGTIMESSHIPLAKWIGAFFLMCASKKGISALQMQRMLGVTYKTAWFMNHRIRFAMDESSSDMVLSGTVEADETYIGGKPRVGDGKTHTKGRGTEKTAVMVLVERNGKARTQVIPDAQSSTLKGVIREYVDPSSRIMTDEHNSYKGIGKEFAGGHHTVNHGKKEYSRGDINSNTAESFFALLKRGVYGSFHHISKQHTPKYINEFAFRWNNRDITDGERMQVAFSQIEGKRLLYREPKIRGGNA